MYSHTEKGGDNWENMASANATKCPECGGVLKIQEDVVVGEIVSCSDCGSDYEVASIESGSVSLKVAEAVKEDWGE